MPLGRFCMIHRLTAAMTALGGTLLLPLLSASAQNAPEKPVDPPPVLELPTVIEGSAPAAPPVIKPMLTKPTESDPAPMSPLPPVQRLDIPPPMPVKIEAPAKYKANDIMVSADGKSVQLVGSISDGMAARLKFELEKNPDVKTLVLTSDGGLLIEGVALAHVVRKFGLDTHVEFLCGSACTIPLLAGKERSVAPDGLVGFHQASTMFGPLLGIQSGADEAGNILLRNTYAEAKLGAPLVDSAMETPPSDMLFPDAATLSANGVITRIANSAEFPMTSPLWKSVKEYRDALADDPLWKAAKTDRPDDYAFASSFGWIMSSQLKDKTKVLRAARVILQRRILAGAPSYPDALLDEYLGVETDVWDESMETKNSECSVGSGSGLGFPVSNPEPGKLRDRQLAVLQKMMAIPAQKQLPDQPAQHAAQAQVMAFWGRMISEQSIGSYRVGLSFCREPLSYFEEMGKMPLAERASLLRSLILTQSTTVR